MARALAGERVEFEARMPYRDNLVKYIHTCFVPDVQQGQVVGFYCLINDITEQVVARAEMERQQQQLRDLFIVTPGPIAMLEGSALVFTLVNPAYQQLFPNQELLGHSLLEVLPQLATSTIPGLCQHLYKAGETYLAEGLSSQLLYPTAKSTS